MADDDSRNEDAKKRSGKSSKPAGGDDKSAKSGGKDDKAKDSAEAKTEKSGKAVKTDEKKSDDKSAAKTAESNRPRGPFGRLLVFFREVVDQLRKVVYPTRKQLLTYTAVVLMFVMFMMAVISGLDWAFSHGVEWMFGAKTE